MKLCRVGGMPLPQNTGANHIFLEKNVTKSLLLPDGGDQKAFRWLAILGGFRGWLLLGILLATFEIWIRVAYNATFVFNQLNVKLIAPFTVTPILLVGSIYRFVAKPRIFLAYVFENMFAAFGAVK
jgi:hypothetical protein